MQSKSFGFGLCAAAALVVASNHADAAAITLTTSAPPGSPLLMGPGSTSGPMLITVVSDATPPIEQMAGWQFQLQAVGEVGASGAFAFNSPVSNPSPAPPATPPPAYIFGADGDGIRVINAGFQLDANDLVAIAHPTGSNPVPTSPGANLLQLDFTAGPATQGLFGIYAVQGSNTIWSDNLGTVRYFDNVPNGNSVVKIGEVLVVVPEPVGVAALGLFALGLRRRQR